MYSHTNQSVRSRPHRGSSTTTTTATTTTASRINLAGFGSSPAATNASNGSSLRGGTLTVATASSKHNRRGNGYKQHPEEEPEDDPLREGRESAVTDDISMPHPPPYTIMVPARRALMSNGHHGRSVGGTDGMGTPPYPPREEDDEGEEFGRSQTTLPMKTQ